MAKKMCTHCGINPARSDHRNTGGLCNKCQSSYRRREKLNPVNKLFDIFNGVNREKP